MCRVVFTVQPYHLNNAQLELLIHARDLIVYAQDVLHRLRHRTICEEDKGVALACRIALRGEERLYELGRVGNEVFILPVDGVHGEDGVLADVGVTVFEARAAGWDEWLQKLRIF